MTKIVIEKSNGQIKIENRIKELTEKKKKDGFLTPHENRILQNNLYKIDVRSASKLYKEICTLTDVQKLELLGKSKFPTAKEFFAALPNKGLFSMWDALGVLTKMNKVSVVKTKVAKQNKTTAKK